MTPSHPIDLIRLLWPDTVIYSKQAEIIESVRYNQQTFVPAGNKLGKDFTAGLIALGAFLFPRIFLGGDLPSEECRVITTSVKDDHLRVLWGEIGRFLSSCAMPITIDKGGPLLVNHREIRKTLPGLDAKGNPRKELCSISYLRGMVSERGEGMAGHHAAYTLLIIDEASGVDDVVYTQADTWAKRMLVIGNPNPTANFFARAVERGDVLQG